MNAALRAYLPSVGLPDPTLTPCERIILETHPVELMIRATDAENTCEHDNLPFDADPDCECWTRARTAALLGQAPLDDGCPGLDRAAALDLSIPASRKGRHEMAEIHHQEVQMDSSNGSAPTGTQFPTAQEMHDWYMDEDTRTLSNVAEHFNVGKSTVVRRFELAGMPCKPRGGGRRTGLLRGSSPTAPPEIKVPCPETPIEGIASTVVALERELLALNLRRSKVEGAIEVLRELAA